MPRARDRVSVSVVIPVYRDSEPLAAMLDVTEWSGAEVIVVSAADDSTVEAVRRRHRDLVWTEAARGRARQMNAGAAIARGEWLVFLHADSRLPSGWRAAVDAAARQGNVALGCFRLALDSRSWFARAIELGVRARVAIAGLPYGDQALFVRRSRFAAVGGYADLPIMEDVDLVRRMRREGTLFRSKIPVVTSARRWERDGWIPRTARHLMLIALYFCGVPPERLIRLDRERAPHPESPGPRMSL
jgi:rSAM/selenodomain-associated transferase 2